MDSSSEESVAPAHEAHSINTDEIASALGHYDIGEVRSIRVYPRGSSRSPKALVESGIGSLILKRRGPGRDDPRRIVFEHAVHQRLESEGFPVVEIIRSAKSGSTVVRASGHIYELFRYIKASRCDGEAGSLESCGRTLAILHDTLLDFDEESPPVQSFHGVSDLVRHVERYADTIRSRGRRSCKAIIEGYQEAAWSVDALGWQEWPVSIVHGDWHPGNVLYDDGGQVSVVLDFDAARCEPRASDLASAILYFGRYVSRMHSGQESTWPVTVNHAAASSIVSGYAEAANRAPLATELAAIPALMVEAIILETMPSVIKNGRFGPHKAAGFLPQVVESIKRIQGDSGRLITSLRAIVK